MLGEQLDLAEQHLSEALRLDPRLFEAHYYLGRLRFTQARMEEAAEHFKTASELRPEDYQTPLLLGGIYTTLGRRDEAERTYRKGLEIAERHVSMNPDDTRALYLSAGAIVILGDVETGTEWAGRALSMAPGDPSVRYNVACVYAQANEIDRAVECLEEAVTILAQPSYLRWIENDSDLDPVREDPRFQALLERLRGGGSEG